jgi:hypothetical protein
LADGVLDIFGAGNCVLKGRRVVGANSIAHVSFALNERRFATQSSELVQAWETETGELLDTFTGVICRQTAVLSPEGQLLATYDPALRISLVGGRHRGILQYHMTSDTPFYEYYLLAFLHCRHAHLGLALAPGEPACCTQTLFAFFSF